MSLVLRRSSAQIIGDARENARRICQAKEYMRAVQVRNMEYGVVLAILDLGPRTLQYLTPGQRLSASCLTPRSTLRVVVSSLGNNSTSVFLSTFPRDTPFLTLA